MGGKTRVSEVLNRKRALTKSMIINLSKAFDISVEALMPKV
jgi:antitoxin component HigA of HigAB toxin-antitoxin module